VEEIKISDVEKLNKVFEVINSRSLVKLAIIYTLLHTEVCHVNGFYKILKINKGSIVNAIKALESKGIIRKCKDDEDIAKKETFKFVMRKCGGCGDYHIKGAKFYKLNDDFKTIFESLNSFIESRLSDDVIESVKSYKREIRLRHKEIREKSLKWINLLKQELQKLSDHDKEELRKTIENGKIHRIINYFNERYTYTDEMLKKAVADNFDCHFSVFPRRVILILDKIKKEGMDLKGILQKLEEG